MSQSPNISPAVAEMDTWQLSITDEAAIILSIEGKTEGFSPRFKPVTGTVNTGITTSSTHV
ncbi:MAG: hypothetical protein IPO92_10845 [Saprospiraceae bacterium]|nr:hypothetical protein [Saprospiraceae bacterium]